MLTNDDYPQFILLCSHLRNELTYLHPVIAMDVGCRELVMELPFFFLLVGVFILVRHVIEAKIALINSIVLWNWVI